MTRPISPLLPIAFSSEVAAARSRSAPIVALESTIITHGMPYPGNLEMARSVEAIIRDEGAVPATIAVIDGTLHVGLEPEMLEKLARTPDAMKLSRADLAFAIAERRTGATTVAATMIAAARAGIKVFATGGIGGVHRGAETSFDISADLQELATTENQINVARVRYNEAVQDYNTTIRTFPAAIGAKVIYGSKPMVPFTANAAAQTAPTVNLDNIGAAPGSTPGSAPPANAGANDNAPAASSTAVGQ